MRHHVHGGDKSWHVVSCLGFAVALLSVVSHPAQAQSTCTEWSPWERVSNQLDFSFRICEQTRNRVEILWKWSNPSPDDLTFSYWIHLRNPAGCRDRVRGALRSGEHTLAAGTTQDLDSRASIRNSEFEGVFVCVSPAAEPEDPSILLGRRVRLSTLRPQRQELVGTVTTVGPSGLTLLVERSDAASLDSVIVVPLDRVEDVAVSRGIRSSLKAGLEIGTLVGGITGAVFGLLTTPPIECRNVLTTPLRSASGLISAIVNFERFTRFREQCSEQATSERAGAFATYGILVGSAMGLIIGSRIRGERWARVRLSLARRSDNRFGMSVSVTF